MSSIVNDSFQCLHALNDVISRTKCHTKVYDDLQDTPRFHLHNKVVKWGSNDDPFYNKTMSRPTV